MVGGQFGRKIFMIITNDIKDILNGFSEAQFDIDVTAVGQNNSQIASHIDKGRALDNTGTACLQNSKIGGCVGTIYAGHREWRSATADIGQLKPVTIGVEFCGQGVGLSINQLDNILNAFGIAQINVKGLSAAKGDPEIGPGDSVDTFTTIQSAQQSGVFQPGQISRWKIRGSDPVAIVQVGQGRIGGEPGERRGIDLVAPCAAGQIGSFDAGEAVSDPIGDQFGVRKVYLCSVGGLIQQVEVVSAIYNILTLVTGKPVVAVSAVKFIGTTAANEDVVAIKAVQGSSAAES